EGVECLLQQLDSRLYTREYRATGRDNPAKRMEFSWQKPGILLDFHPCYSLVVVYWHHFVPFSTGMRPRVRTMLYIFGEYALDTQRHTLQRAGQNIPVRRKVFQALTYLLVHHDRVVSKHELCAHVWPEQFISETALESTIKAVRQAIGDSGRGQQRLQT